jgi:hypothetical protein
MKKIWLVVGALCLALTLAPSAFAWNAFGHMMIAAVAYNGLTPAAHAEVTKLLRLNPSYPQWVAGVAAADRDEVAFLMAANWADAIKSAPGYRNDGDRPSSPDAARNIGYSDMLQHRYWHYVDLPFSPDHTPLVDPVAPNALTQISMFRKTLASATASDELKSYDLVWLLHVVGDVHQPLHATSRFTRSQPKGDAGGNFVALCERPCRNELHAFWDDLPGTSRKPEVAIKRIRRLPRPDARLVAVDDEAKWVEESFQIAQTAVYAPPIGIGAGPFTLDAPYRKAAHKVARQRIALAGARLARVLNETFK